MKRIGLYFIVSFCLFNLISNHVIKTQFEMNQKYCLKKYDYFFGKVDGILKPLTSLAYHFIEITDNFIGRDKYMSYDDMVNAKKEREIKFRQSYPDYELINFAKENGVKCVLYDKRIDILDDMSFVEIPYNFRPIK